MDSLTHLHSKKCIVLYTSQRNSLKVTALSNCEEAWQNQAELSQN